MENYFKILNDINVSDKVEEKNGLTYLSWAWAWAEIKKLHPTANYKVYEQENGCIYWTDGKTAWVKTGVTVNEIEHIEYLPIMDFRNNSIPVEKITSFEVNKAIQRSLTKAVARHGLGLYIYAGEDLPESEKTPKDPTQEPKKENKKTLIKTNKITKVQIKKLKDLGVNLEDMAVYFKVKTIEEVNFEDAKIIITKQERKLEKEKAAVQKEEPKKAVENDKK